MLDSVPDDPRANLTTGCERPGHFSLVLSHSGLVSRDHCTNASRAQDLEGEIRSAQVRLGSVGIIAFAIGERTEKIRGRIFGRCHDSQGGV